MSQNNAQRLPAEWEPQSFVQLTWPHAETDWADYLDDAYKCFIDIAREVNKREDLVIVTPEPEAVEQQLKEAGIFLHGAHSIVLYECPTNDTWARDHAFITTLSTSEPASATLHDFGFNGWGQKFASDKDNLINECLHLDEMFDEDVCYTDNRKVILEGGSIESDGQGTLLTTTPCLFAPNRNWYTEKEEAEAMLCSTLGAKRVLWLDHGNLSGDDTDGHVDTLARLCPNDTIVYVKCDDTADLDYEELHEMELDLQELRTAQGTPYRLLSLPMAEPMYEDDGYRLPATYANFLIMNDAVLMPTYGNAVLDAKAISVLQQAFPDREIVGIDCRVLVRQHGSLHCVTMQYPEAVILNI